MMKACILVFLCAGGKPCKRLRLKNGVTLPLLRRHRSGGEVVSYLCHHGYHLAGYPSSVYYVDVYCLGNGSWSRALPNCTGKGVLLTWDREQSVVRIVACL